MKLWRSWEELREAKGVDVIKYIVCMYEILTANGKYILKVGETPYCLFVVVDDE